MRSKLTALTVAVLAFAAFSVCMVSYASASHAAKTSKAATVKIVYANKKKTKYAFKPATVKIKKGGTVTWVNKTNAEETASAPNNKWSTNLIEPGKKQHWVFKKSGTYKYKSFVDGYMKGEVKVK